jgi:hypothetical protein
VTTRPPTSVDTKTVRVKPETEMEGLDDTEMGGLATRIP